MIMFDQATCRDLSTARRREWIETNGMGGYASSAIVGLNTRRYHGLLVAATRPPLGRMVLLSKVEETILIGGHRYDLSTNRYPGAIYPAGSWSVAELMRGRRSAGESRSARACSGSE